MYLQISVPIKFKANLFHSLHIKRKIKMLILEHKMSNVHMIRNVYKNI